MHIQFEKVSELYRQSIARFLQDAEDWALQSPTGKPWKGWQNPIIVYHLPVTREESYIVYFQEKGLAADHPDILESRQYALARAVSIGLTEDRVFGIEVDMEHADANNSYYAVKAFFGVGCARYSVLYKVGYLNDLCIREKAEYPWYKNREDSYHTAERPLYTYQWVFTVEGQDYRPPNEGDWRTYANFFGWSKKRDDRVRLAQQHGEMAPILFQKLGITYTESSLEELIFAGKFPVYQEADQIKPNPKGGYITYLSGGKVAFVNKLSPDNVYRITKNMPKFCVLAPYTQSIGISLDLSDVPTTQSYLK